MKKENDILTLDNCFSNYINISLEMRQTPHWGLWKKVPMAGGKMDKIPCNAAGDNISNLLFDQTLEEAAKDFNPAIHAGLGYSFREDDPYVGIDYDHVLNENGDITQPEILAEVEALCTFTEESQSHTGLHCICTVKEWPADMKQGTKKKAGEMYYSGRFFAITGDMWKKSPAEIRTIEPELIRRIYDRLNPQKEAPARPPQAAYSSAISDFEIITRLRDSQKTRALYDGDISAYDSQSEADLALCNHIAFYTKNPQQINAVFQKSGLMRGKWTEARGKETYGDITITEALRTTRGQYDPFYHSRRGAEIGRRIFARMEERRQACQN